MKPKNIDDMTKWLEGELGKPIVESLTKFGDYIDDLYERVKKELNEREQDSDDTKDTDTDNTPVTNTTVKQKDAEMEATLELLVMKAVKLHFQNNTSFSAYDITSFIRDKSNSGEWIVKGAEECDIDNDNDYNTTYIGHDAVKAIIRQMEDHDLFPGSLSVSHQTSGGSTFRLFVPTSVGDPDFDGEPDADPDDTMVIDNRDADSPGVDLDFGVTIGDVNVRGTKNVIFVEEKGKTVVSVLV